MEDRCLPGFLPTIESYFIYSGVLYKLGAKIHVFFEKVAIVWRKVEKNVTFRHAISTFGANFSDFRYGFWGRVRGQVPEPSIYN